MCFMLDPETCMIHAAEGMVGLFTVTG